MTIYLIRKGRNQSLLQVKQMKTKNIVIVRKIAPLTAMMTQILQARMRKGH